MLGLGRARIINQDIFNMNGLARTMESIYRKYSFLSRKNGQMLISEQSLQSVILNSSTEGMFTNFDQNSFSSIDDEHNNGFAHYHSLNLNVPIFSKGKVQTSAYYRAHDKYFYSLARIESAETQYKTSDFAKTDTVEVSEYGGHIETLLPEMAHKQIALL